MTWVDTRLVALATSRVSNVDKHSVEGERPVRLCNYTDVYYNDAIRDSLPFMQATASPTQVERFRLHPGDVVITKDSETADDIGIPAFVESAGEDLICGYHLAILRPKTVVVPRYLYWSLTASHVAAQWEVMATGVTRVGLKASDLKTVRLRTPAMVNEQQAIADFLDRETAKIDALIEKQNQLVRLLHERRRYVVANALEPPEGTPTVPLKRALYRIQQGISPDTSTGTEDAEVWVLKAGATNHGVFDENESKPVPPDVVVPRGIEVRLGDILVSRASGSPDLVGSAAIVGPFGRCLILSDKTFRLVPDRGASTRFLYWFLNSPSYRSQVQLAISGADGLANNLPLSSLRRMRLHLPTLEKQQLIAEHLDDETAKIDVLIAKAEEFVCFARERRAALITAAVSGQIDVLGEAS